VWWYSNFATKESFLHNKFNEQDLEVHQEKKVKKCDDTYI